MKRWFFIFIVACLGLIGLGAVIVIIQLVFFHVPTEVVMNWGS